MNGRLRYWDPIVGGWKGSTKRSPQEETSLRVRILDGRHIQDVYDKLVDELGPAEVRGIGPLDMSRNPLEAWTRRLGKAYTYRPPLTTGLSPDLADLIGDMSAATTIRKYAGAGGRPMPSRMLSVCSDALRYRVGCNYVGIAVGWSPKQERPFLRLVTPDDLQVVYASDDPLSPTVITHRLVRPIGGREVETFDVYDLADLDSPSYRTFSSSGEDITNAVHGRTYEGADYWWRYTPTAAERAAGKLGRPFHRIVVSGNPREPFEGVQLVELTLKLCMFYTHFGAAIRDAGHPQRNVRGLHLAGEDSRTDDDGGGQGGTGVQASPRTVLRWVRDSDEDPGEHWQDNPGADLSSMLQAIQAYEQAPAATALGLPLDFGRSGGEPTEQERLAVEEAIRATYPDCRGQDVLILRRVAAVANRAAEMAGGTAIYAEGGYGVLYREEVDEALADVREPAEEEPEPTPDEGEEE